MFIKDFLSKPLKKISILTISSMLLGATFTTSTWAMEDESQCQHTPAPIQTHASLFNYDLNHLEEAKKIVAQAQFLPDDIRSFFEQSSKVYDRIQFLKYLDSKEKESFLLNIASNDKLSISEQLRSHLPATLIQQMEDDYFEANKRELPPLYEPYFNNIDHNIRERGALNYALFDAFFYMVLGVGGANSSLEEGGPEATQKLFLQLGEANFLKNFNMESLANVKEIYSPCKQLEIFNKNKTEEVTDLVIAGGHVGMKGMESISRYKNTLAIDLSPFQVPDVIADINDHRLLQSLRGLYESHFKVICDTSNIGVFQLEEFGFMKPETTGMLVRMLRPGGHLRAQMASDKDLIPFDETNANYYITTYGLVPIYSGDKIVALEKK